MAHADQGNWTTKHTFIATLVIIFGTLLTTTYLQVSHPIRWKLFWAKVDHSTTYGIHVAFESLPADVMVFLAIIIMSLILLYIPFLIFEHAYKYGKQKLGR